MIDDDDELWTTKVDWHPMSVHLRLQCPVCHDRSGFSGNGALYIRCPSCRTVYRLPEDIPLEMVDLKADADGVLDADTENLD